VGRTSFGSEEVYGLIPHNFDGFGVPNALWLYESNVKEYGQPRRYSEFRPPR
jgi:hypothetical protein